MNNLETENQSKRIYSRGQFLRVLSLGAATAVLSTSNQEVLARVSSEIIKVCGTPVQSPVTKEQVEKSLGVKMGTLPDYYENVVPCGSLLNKKNKDEPEMQDFGINIGLKKGAPPVPALLYPEILDNFPGEWSKDSLEILLELSKRMPGYYAPILPKPALLVLSTIDAVNTPEEPLNQAVVTFRLKTIDPNNLPVAAITFLHEGAHLGDPITIIRLDSINDLYQSYTTCSQKPDPNVQPPEVKSPLHRAIYQIFPGSSYSNPPPVMLEWAENEFKKSAEKNNPGIYDPNQRWAYGIRRKFPVEFLAVATELIMQGRKGFDYLMETAKPLIGMGLLNENQVARLRALIVNEGPLKGRTLNELSCIFN